MEHVRERFKDVLIDVYAYDKLSPFAKFCLQSKGYKYMYKGRELDKWEVFDMGFEDVDKIKNGLTPIIIFPK